MTDKLEDRMQGKIDAAKRRIDASPDGRDPGPDEPVTEEAPDPDELRQVFRKFRRLMGAVGNPSTVEIKGALRAGWIISSGKVEGYGDELFHVVMLTNGALHYFSGELTGDPIELTSKWFLGDSIPALEAKMPDTVAGIMAVNNISWLETEPPPA
ncbi:MAG TPA: hypothetical protein VFV09_04325 [Actinomycetota bacterium]|jgi:hypothetical protein|nr:hypothetical protein [Actinomycetota bacterium]